MKYVQLYSRNEGKFNGTDYLFTINNNSNITSPATPVSFLIGSSASDVYVIEEVQHRPKPKTIEVQSEFLFHNLSKEVKEITVTPTVEDIGGMGVNFVFVKDNRIYLSNQQVQVQNDADDLKVEVLTFRDKIEPGNTETWTVKISGKNNEAVAAEVLTSMPLSTNSGHMHGSLRLKASHSFMVVAGAATKTSLLVEARKTI